MSGFFIALEGTDGSGKTTVLEGLRGRFKSEGLEVLYTREPGGTAISEQIREILLSPKNRAMVPQTEALLYAASRAQHVAETIRPALEAGKVVFTDRYLLSSYAYQGVARGLGIETVQQINDLATGGLLPDLTLFLDVDPVIVLKRKAEREPQDRLEASGERFFLDVYRGYQLAIQKMEGVQTIDAAQSPSLVVEEAWKRIQSAMKSQKGRR